MSKDEARSRHTCAGASSARLDTDVAAALPAVARQVPLSAAQTIHAAKGDISRTRGGRGVDRQRIPPVPESEVADFPS